MLIELVILLNLSEVLALKLAPSLNVIYDGAFKTSNLRETTVRSYRVAVLTSGTLTRYFLQSAASSLLKPMSEQGHTVDYYLTINTENFKSFKSGASSFVAEEQLRNATLPEAEELIRQTINQTGARLRYLKLNERVSVDEENEQNFCKRGKFKGAAARRNMVKYLRGLEELRVSVANEVLQTKAYDYVVIVLDDALWIRPFDLNYLLANADAASARHGLNLKCDRSHSTWAAKAGQLHDNILVLNWQAAQPYMSQYSILLKNADCKKYWKTYNMERFLKILADDYRITFESVPVELIPMQRGGHRQEQKKDGTVVTHVCLHYQCDSESDKGKLLHPESMYSSCNDQ